MPMIARDDITGLILAGGRGSRMGGVDKGLQNHHGMPLAMHALLRLAPQVGHVMINANRNLGAYESFGVPVWPDALPDYRRAAGRLSGRARALRDAVSRDRAVRLAALPARPGRAPGRGARRRRRRDRDRGDARRRRRARSQPVFCLMQLDADGEPGALHARRASARSIAGRRCTAASRCCSTTRARSSTPTRSHELQQLQRDG